MYLYFDDFKKLPEFLKSLFKNYNILYNTMRIVITCFFCFFFYISAA